MPLASTHRTSDKSRHMAGCAVHYRCGNRSVPCCGAGRGSVGSAQPASDAESNRLDAMSRPALCRVASAYVVSLSPGIKSAMPAVAGVLKLAPCGCAGRRSYRSRRGGWALPREVGKRCGRRRNGAILALPTVQARRVWVAAIGAKVRWVPIAAGRQSSPRRRAALEPATAVSILRRWRSLTHYVVRRFSAE